MTRDEFVHMAMLYGCRDLEIEPVKIEIYQGSFFGNPDINAIALMKDHKIMFQEKWYESAKEEELLIALFHELRHIYQNKVIKESNLHKYLVTNQLIKWKNEMLNYKKPDRKNTKLYLKQDIELDAFVYSRKLLKSYLYKK